MKLMVLGASGFIGSHVAAHLVRCGADVTRADVRTLGDTPCLLFDGARPDFDALFASGHWDAVVNCTGAASVPASFEAPWHDFELNTVRVAQMLDSLRRNGCGARFINLSSAAVYGNPDRVPIRECDATHPLSPYGWHKAQAEALCHEYHLLFGMPTLSVRIFSAFGPGLRKQLFWDVHRKLREGGPLRLFGTGEETRDFIYVEDVAACIELLLRKGRFDGEPVNLASGQSVTVREAVTTFLAALDDKTRLEFSGAERVGDPVRWQADVSTIAALGFAPHHTLAEGLAKVGAWLQAGAPESATAIPAAPINQARTPH